MADTSPSILDREWPGNDATYRELLTECAVAFESAVGAKLPGQIMLDGPCGRVAVYAGMGSMIRDFLEEMP